MEQIIVIIRNSPNPSLAIQVTDVMSTLGVCARMQRYEAVALNALCKDLQNIVITEQLQAEYPPCQSQLPITGHQSALDKRCHPLHLILTLHQVWLYTCCSLLLLCSL